jgi:membrane-associated protease RseP (regulator of RpoE activity)
MVLTLRKFALVVLIAFAHAGVAAAQRGSQPIPQRRSGDVRPMLFGFALGCLNCQPGERPRGRGGAPPVVSYRSFPQVLSVAPGSAAEQAGVKEGDILQSIDGVSVLTDEGAARLARAAEGDQVRLAFERNSKPIEISLVLGANVGRKPGGPTRIVSGYLSMETARGAAVSDMKIEIWSDDPIVGQEPTSTDGQGEVVLRIGDKTMIRLRLRKEPSDSARRKPENSGEPR